MKKKRSQIDIDMLKEVVAARAEQDIPVAMLAHNYQGTDLLIASSRLCDDGAKIDTTVLINCGTRYDLPVIVDTYQGFPRLDPFPFKFTPRYFYH